jgi:hypothetical protein
LGRVCGEEGFDVAQKSFSWITRKRDEKEIRRGEIPGK